MLASVLSWGWRRCPEPAQVTLRLRSSEGGQAGETTPAPSCPSAGSRAGGLAGSTGWVLMEELVTRDKCADSAIPQPRPWRQTVMAVSLLELSSRCLSLWARSPPPPLATAGPGAGDMGAYGVLCARSQVMGMPVLGSCPRLEVRPGTDRVNTSGGSSSFSARSPALTAASSPSCPVGLPSGPSW